MLAGESRDVNGISKEQYLGEKKKQLRDGFGVYVYENKFFRYEGEWKDGKKHGHGKLLMADGSYYEGQFENGEIRGYGFRFWSNSGNKYAGQFHKGEMHGRGVMEYKDGAVYEGDWSRNVRQGRGTLTDKDGQVYEGEFYKHKKHGEGKMSFLNGDEFQGHWVADNRQGQGFLQCQDGTTYDGQWLNDVFSGHGVMRHCSGIVYEGQWLHGQPASMPAKLCVSNGPQLQCSQGMPFEVVAEVRTEDDEVLSLESGRELRVTAAFRSRPPVRPTSGAEPPSTPLLDVIEDAEEKARPTPFDYDVVSFPLTDEVPLNVTETTLAETALPEDAEEAGEETATEEGAGGGGAGGESAVESASEAAVEADSEAVAQPVAAEEGVEHEETSGANNVKTEGSVSADVAQEEEPIAPVPNIRTDEGCGVWETLILPKAPPLYRPYSLLDEDAGILSTSAKEARSRSKDRKKTKEKMEAEEEASEASNDQDTSAQLRRRRSSSVKEDAKAKYKRLGNPNFARPGEYVIIVEDVTEPPFFGGRLEPAFLRVELQAPKRERRSTMKKPEEKKKQWSTKQAIANAMVQD